MSDLRRCPRQGCQGRLIRETDPDGAVADLCLLCGRRWVVERAFATIVSAAALAPRGRGRPKGDRVQMPRGYRSSAEVADALGLSKQAINGRLWRGEIAGAIREGPAWCIPSGYVETAPRDGRRKTL